MLKPTSFFFFNDTATTEIYTLSLHDALPIWRRPVPAGARPRGTGARGLRRNDPPAGTSSSRSCRSEEHTSELQSLRHLVCRLLLAKKKSSEQADHKRSTLECA